MNIARYGRRLVAMAALLFCGPGHADTGPEYLEDEPEQDPISSGFHLFALPFEEERQNTLHLRTFYQNRTIERLQDRENWAGGGWLNVEGSYWDARLKLAGTLYTSQKLYADDDKAETGALQPVHNSYSQLGEIYSSLTLGQLAIQAGRYAVELPYINMNDTRMTPQTFQGAQAIYRVREDGGWDVGVGVLSDIKRRTRQGFDSLYEAAGLDGNEDVFVGASILQTEPGSLAGIYLLHAPDYHNGIYVEASRRFWLKADRYIQLSAQYTYQQSTGDELDGDFDVQHYGARITWKEGWYSGSIAYTDYPEEDRLRRPWGGIPGYTSVMVSDFNSPRETALLIGGTVDFDSLGARGLSINAKAIFGDTPDCGAAASPDTNEYDLNFSYRPPIARLEGLRLQLRFAHVERDDTCGANTGVDTDEVRFVANFPLQF